MQIGSSNSWSLADLLQGWSTVQSPYANTVISGLCMDSRFTSKGDLFMAVKGLQSHGLVYSQQAIRKGAAAIAWEFDPKVKDNDLPNDVPCISIPSLQQQAGFIAHRFYHRPSDHINVIGITGTDGKTSVSQFIAQAFANLNYTCGVIGTLGYGIYPDLGSATLTTPDAVRMQKLMHHFFVKEIKHAVIEASSHGLKQGRLNSISFDTAIFTNLGRDHMDYHQDLEDYGSSKRILFQMQGLKNAIINIDDEFGLQLVNDLDSSIGLVTYSQCGKSTGIGSYVCADKITHTNKVNRIKIMSSWGNASIKTSLLGKFNISNLLAVISALLVSGCSFEDTIKAVSSLGTVPGRMDLVTKNENAPSVIIDYAHTPQALSNVLHALHEQCTGKLWCVFGCGGDRDPGKRALMAEAVEQFADNAVITDDNPRSEDPSEIVKDIISGFSQSANYQLIHNRQQAIEYAIKNASLEDTVLIAGKGHEAVQIINNSHLPFDDKKIAEQILKEYTK